MNAPILWGVVPMGMGLALLIARRWERQVNWVGGVFMMLLAGSVFVLPVNEAIRIGPWSLRLGEVLEILGRRFVITNTDRGVFGLIYLLAGVWFLGALVARPGKLFVPLGMIVVVLWVGALAVDPFLYAALFLEIAVIISIPFLRPIGGAAGPGVLRYLVFQTLGMPFILFTGWILGQVNPDLVNLQQLALPAILVGFGFALLMAVFPFHTWLPMMAEEVHPYLAAFIFFMLPFVVALFGLGFLNEFSWLRNAPAVYALLQAVGFLMTLTGGIWAAFDFSVQRNYFPTKMRHLGRIIGFATIVTTGLSLLAISLGSTIGLEVFFELLIPRALFFLIWALALSVLREQTGTLEFFSLQGVGRKLPVIALALILAHFSAAGFPLLGGFPIRFLLLERLAEINTIGALGMILGELGLIVAALRILAVLVMTPVNNESERVFPLIQETNGVRIVFVAGTILLFLLGLFPRWLTPLMASLSMAFPALGP